jgi:hypothetical protein
MPEFGSTLFLGVSFSGEAGRGILVARRVSSPSSALSYLGLVLRLFDMESLGGGRLCRCCQPLVPFLHAGGDHGVEEWSESPSDSSTWNIERVA